MLRALRSRSTKIHTSSFQTIASIAQKMSDSDSAAEEPDTRKLSPFRRQSSSGLNDSIKKINPLQTAYITVENKDGHLQQLPVSVSDEGFNTREPILQSLAELGEIEACQPITPKARKRIVQALRRGSVAPAPAAAADTGTQKSNTNQLNNLNSHNGAKRGSETFLSPNLLSDLQKKKQRIVAKGGQCNVQLNNVMQKKIFLKDIFTTCVDMRWRYTFSVFGASFFVSWLIFGFIYWIIAQYRGDFLPENLPSGAAQQNGTWKPCVLAIEDFASCFLFSVETQHTIG
jgi:hypothetical protein